MTSNFSSQLFDEKTFYQKFSLDLLNCREEVIIESPYITTTRVDLFYPRFQTLLKRKVKIYVVTKDFDDLESEMREQSMRAVENFEKMGIHTLLCMGNHHRKLAILDRAILWEGSLNILSQTRSREIMRRIEGKEIAEQMFNFLEFRKVI